MDTRNRYFHVILTSKFDDCSQAKLGDLYSLNMTMASCAKYFKTAFIQYQSRDNVELRNQLLHLALSCQKKLDTQTQSMLESSATLDQIHQPIDENKMDLEATFYKTAKVSSIKK